MNKAVGMNGFDGSSGQVKAGVLGMPGDSLKAGIDQQRAHAFAAVGEAVMHGLLQTAGRSGGQLLFQRLVNSPSAGVSKGGKWHLAVDLIAIERLQLRTVFALQQLRYLLLGQG